MLDKETIFDNIEQYYNDLDRLIKDLSEVGITNFDDFNEARLKNFAYIPSGVREQIKEKFEVSQSESVEELTSANQDELDWAHAQSVNTVESYQNYLDNYPDGEYRFEAKQSLKALLSQANDVVESAPVDTVAPTQPISDTPIIQPEDDVPVSQPEDDTVYTEPISDTSTMWPINDTPTTQQSSFLRSEESDYISLYELQNTVEEIRLDKDRYTDVEQAVYEYIKQYLCSGELSKNVLIEAIATDWNFLSSDAIHQFYKDGILTDQDLDNTGIDRDFLRLLKMGFNRQTFGFSTISRVAKVPSTEVYFWGVPSSGKTCALGAILSCANSGRVATVMEKDPNCGGYDYMNRLANVFSKQGVGVLPPGTPPLACYEMGFNLIDKKDKVHPITCIDLAGEVIEDMYYWDANRDQLSDQQKQLVETVTSILSDKATDNRKMHFFVLEYGGENKLYKGLTQADLLHGAMAYIKRTGILRKQTDAIYILITKVDKIKAVNAQELQDKILAYIEEHYLGFYNLLGHICRENEINGGTVLRQPFTLGKVCSQKLCKYDGQAAANVVQIFLDRSFGYSAKKWAQKVQSMEN